MGCITGGLFDAIDRSIEKNIKISAIKNALMGLYIKNGCICTSCKHDKLRNDQVKSGRIEGAFPKSRTLYPNCLNA
jgi:hypothetical protein